MSGINIVSGGLRNTITTEFGEKNRIDFVYIKDLNLHNNFNGLVWCNNLYYNPNPTNQSLYDITYNMIDGNGQSFTCRQWAVSIDKDTLDKLKNTPTVIQGTVITINNKLYYRIDYIDFSSKYTNLPKSTFIKEVEYIDVLCQRIIEFLSAARCEYAKYWLNNLNYLERFKQSPYSNNKSKYLGDKLSALDYILSSLNRLNIYKSNEDCTLLSTMIVLYYCIEQDKEDFGVVNYQNLLTICSSDYYNKLAEVISLCNIRNTYYIENEHLRILSRFINSFEELL